MNVKRLQVDVHGDFNKATEISKDNIDSSDESDGEIGDKKGLYTSIIETEEANVRVHSRKDAVKKKRHSV